MHAIFSRNISLACPQRTSQNIYLVAKTDLNTSIQQLPCQVAGIRNLFELQGKYGVCGGVVNYLNFNAKKVKETGGVRKYSFFAKDYFSHADKSS